MNSLLTLEPAEVPTPSRVIIGEIVSKIHDERSTATRGDQSDFISDALT